MSISSVNTDVTAEEVYNSNSNRLYVNDIAYGSTVEYNAKYYSVIGIIPKFTRLEDIDIEVSNYDVVMETLSRPGVLISAPLRRIQSIPLKPHFNFQNYILGGAFGKVFLPFISSKVDISDSIINTIQLCKILEANLNKEIVDSISTVHAAQKIFQSISGDKILKLIVDNKGNTNV